MRGWTSGGEGDCGWCVAVVLVWLMMDGEREKKLLTRTWGSEDGRRRGGRCPRDDFGGERLIFLSYGVYD